VPENQIPSLVSSWVGALYVILIIAALLWLVMMAARYFHRRAYNLSPVESAGKGKTRPDFLSVDHEARGAQMAGGRAVEAPAQTPERYSRALGLARITATAMAFVSFLSAVLFSIMRIEAFEAAWQRVTAWERFVAIVQEYPVGFAIAVVLMMSAFVRLLRTVRSV